MEFAVVSLAAFIASLLTLFSGFGLGTLLMPVVGLFFPVEVAIAITAVVHLANNLFKFVLFAKAASGTVLLRFGLPAMIAALAGAGVLSWISHLQPLFEYTVAGRALEVLPVKFVVGLLILVFVGIESLPAFSRVEVSPRYLPLGGLVSGFFGGISGHQGALRSMFLIKAGLGKEAFISMGIVLAVMVDLVRLPVYAWSEWSSLSGSNAMLIVSATLSAFCGAYFGGRILSKVTISFVRWVVALMLLLVGLGLMSGML
ncbi:MAG: hypothetical protein RLZZ303_2669 [Candidatus Hydrogenedentota bacterium]|jgi:uncharacterized membrane protein YfcA